MLHRIASVASGAVLGVAVAVAIVTTGPTASARADYDSAYGYDRTWNAAIRLVRVDLGFKVTEQDATNGYLIFEYKSPESPRPSPGSIELVRSADADGPVRVVIQLAQMPRYHEQLMVDELAQKMRREYGDPPVKHEEHKGVPDASVD